MKIEILGTGCAKCRLVEEHTRQAVAELGVPAEIVHVQDVNAIVARGVMMTPALAIDGTVAVSGRVPTLSELKELLRARR